LALDDRDVAVDRQLGETFDGAAGLPAFTKQLETFLDALAPTKARIVLLSPLRQEDLGRPLPDPDNGRPEPGGGCRSSQRTSQVTS